MNVKKHRRTIAIGSSIVFALSVSACGGSGGGVSPITPAPPPPVVTPPTPPTPPVTPPSSANFDTAEYRRSDGPSFHNAVTAYQAGATGSGITVGVIDSGVDATSHEFAGRIHAQSFDATGANRTGVEDQHGTSVARILAAAKDDRDVHGIAFNATILALRADTVNSCTTPKSGETEAECSFGDNAIAAALDRATDVGARVVNISLGGKGGTNSRLTAAVRRATQAGIVIIVSAGNEYNDAEPEYDINNPSPFAQALIANGNGLVIVATSVDDNGVISNFSNRAGASRQTTLSALGSAVCCVYENDTIKRFTENGQNFVYVMNGTSFAAPQIAGAAALLAQAFPTLTGAQIVSLLLTSARDAGDVGTDSTYGRGILDIARAFAPAGTTSLAGTAVKVSLDDGSGTVSGVMGDAASSREGLGAVILDSYGRAYDIDLAHGLRSSAPRLKLTPALASQGRSASFSQGALNLAFSIGESRSPELTSLSLNGEQQRVARVLAGRVSAAISKDTKFSLGIRQSAAAQVAQLQQMSEGSFLVADSARSDNGFAKRTSSALAIRHELGGFGLTASAENGHIQLYERVGGDILRPGYQGYPYASLGFSLDRQTGPVRLSLGTEWLQENETLLGARFINALGLNGANSLFADANAEADLGNGWSVSGSWRQGWTRAHVLGSLLSDSMMTSNSFSIDASKFGAFLANDRLALRVSQPLRVTSGGVSFNVPVAYDYATLSTTFGVRELNLAPVGREIATEMAWMVPLNSGYFTTNVFWRQQPGHFATAPDDMGIAFRLQLGF